MPKNISAPATKRRLSRQAKALKTVGKGLGVRILGIDPAFRNTGWACMELCEHGEAVRSVGLIRTQKSDKKHKILVADDNHRCCREITNALVSAIKAYDPHVICAESMVGSQNAKSATQLGLAQGIISTIVTMLDIPLIQATPQGVKKALCGVNNASKQDIEDAVLKLYPVGGLVGDIKPPSAREHVYDAIAIIKTCLNSTEIQTLRRMQRPTRKQDDQD